MDVVDLLNRLGGVGDARVLFEATSRAAVKAAVQNGLVLHVSRGKYALSTAYVAYREAARLSGVITGASAAAVHGWELKVSPDLPSITVPAKRKVGMARSEGRERRCTSRATPGSLGGASAEGHRRWFRPAAAAAAKPFDAPSGAAKPVQRCCRSHPAAPAAGQPWPAPGDSGGAGGNRVGSQPA